MVFYNEKVTVISRNRLYRSTSIGKSPQVLDGMWFPRNEAPNNAAL